MAKSIHLEEVNNTANHPTVFSRSYWEHWFETQSSRPAFESHLDEHGVWEKAVSLGILAFGKTNR